MITDRTSVRDLWLPSGLVMRLIAAGIGTVAQLRVAVATLNAAGVSHAERAAIRRAMARVR